jgi:hypothetical protein
MELTEKITLDMLNSESVSVVRQQYLNYNGTEMPVGENKRNSYLNTDEDRELLRTSLPENIYNAIIAVWGDVATITPQLEGEN